MPEISKVACFRIRTSTFVNVKEKQLKVLMKSKGKIHDPFLGYEKEFLFQAQHPLK
jgi:hypothetical protein